MIPVAFDLRDPDRSGIARVARSLARAFVRDFGGEFRVTLAGPVSTLQSLGATSWHEGRGKVRLVDWGAGRYSPLAELQWPRVKRDVGDSLWFFPHWDVPWRSRPDRYVMTLHDIGHLRLSEVSLAKRALARRWIHSAASAARAVTTAGESSAREIEGLWPELAPKMKVLPHGVDDLFFQKPKALPAGISEAIGDAPFILSVGIRKRHKNLGVGVDVLARVPHLRWVVVGERFPAWRVVAARAARLGVANRIVEIERVSDDDLNGLYHQASCLLFPSRYEGFGLPIVEALAAGTPVIVANAGAPVETLGGAGWVCDADNPTQFASAVEEVLGLGDRGAAVVAERSVARARQFNWRSSAARLADILRAAA